MTTAIEPSVDIRTIADLLHRLGDISPERVLFDPAPGTATVQDVIKIHGRDKRLCELVDGTLVEKGMGYRESLLAMAIVSALRAFVQPRNLGLISGESGMMKLFAGLVRIPDVAYVSWDRVPGKRVPVDPVPLLVPDLAVEVLSDSNTPAEMARKRLEYFQAGVRLVWIIDPDPRTVAVYTAPEQFTTLGEKDTLSGGDVLPGFTLPLQQLFPELDITGK